MVWARRFSSSKENGAGAAHLQALLCQGLAGKALRSKGGRGGGGLKEAAAIDHG